MKSILILCFAGMAMACTVKDFVPCTPYERLGRGEITAQQALADAVANMNQAFLRTDGVDICCLAQSNRGCVESAIRKYYPQDLISSMMSFDLQTGAQWPNNCPRISLNSPTDMATNDLFATLRGRTKEHPTHTVCPPQDLIPCTPYEEYAVGNVTAQQAISEGLVSINTIKSRNGGVYTCCTAQSNRGCVEFNLRKYFPTEAMQALESFDQQTGPEWPVNCPKASYPELATAPPACTPQDFVPCTPYDRLGRGEITTQQALAESLANVNEIKRRNGGVYTCCTAQSNRRCVESAIRKYYPQELTEAIRSFDEITKHDWPVNCPRVDFNFPQETETPRTLMCPEKTLVPCTPYENYVKGKLTQEQAMIQAYDNVNYVVRKNGGNYACCTAQSNRGCVEWSIKKYFPQDLKESMKSFDEQTASQWPLSCPKVSYYSPASVRNSKLGNPRFL